MRSPEMRTPRQLSAACSVSFGLDFFNLSDAILSAKARDAIASAYGPETPSCFELLFLFLF